jgi:hypothetical protein
MCYAVDTNGGDLWRLDPRSGASWRIGPTGASAWGVAYAADRDALYILFNGGTQRIFVVDPRTADATPLPQPLAHFPTDIAFNAADGYLYGIDNTPPAKLVRIDRDTGVSTVVGNSIPARGIDYDPGTNRLWAVGDGAVAGKFYSVDPLTGAATELTTDPGTGFNDGLAVVRASGSSPTVSVDLGLGLPQGVALQVWPNPARNATRLRFSLPIADEVDARVFDVAGREVRRLHRGPLGAGEHELAWDGRDEAGRAAPAGVYFARVESAGTARVARIVRTQ